MFIEPELLMVALHRRLCGARKELLLNVSVAHED